MFIVVLWLLFFFIFIYFSLFSSILPFNLSSLDFSLSEGSLRVCILLVLACLFELLEIVWLFLSTSFSIFRVSKLCLFGVAQFSAASIDVVFEGTIWVFRCFLWAFIAVDYGIFFSFFKVSHLLSSRLMGFVFILLFLYYHRFFINFLSLRSIYLWKISIFQPALRVVLLYCISWSITIPFIIGTVIYFIHFFHTGTTLWTWPTLTLLTIISWPISIRTLQDRSKSWITIVIFQF